MTPFLAACDPCHLLDRNSASAVDHTVAHTPTGSIRTALIRRQLDAAQSAELEEISQSEKDHDRDDEEVGRARRRTGAPPGREQERRRGGQSAAVRSAPPSIRGSTGWGVGSAS